jgi:simple sugar transport system ATP-binding protein
VSTAPALALEHIARRFGAVRALVDASLTVRAGTVHALLGENGAGKTTLMRIAFGLLRPDAGIIRVGGAPVALSSPAEALALGIGMVHQHFTFVPAMTVAENVALGGKGRYRVERARERVLEVARETGLTLDPDARAGDLPVGAQQRLEIVKALARGARVLILDEPTAVLAPAEASELLATLRRLAELGGAVVIITHKLREALSAADDVTVLRQGRTVLSGRAAALSADTLARAMLGAAAVELSASDAERSIRSTSTSAERDVVLAASDVDVIDTSGVPRLRDATVQVRAGEIVGIAGVEGAGQRELLRVLAGRLSPVRGRVERPERVGFVPEDRQRDALVLELPLYENIALRGAARARGRMPWGAIVRRTTDLIERFDIRAAGPRVPAAALSGGNQQKLVLARELDAPAGGVPGAIVVENPTRGLDLAASAAVHQRLRDARDAGAAVVLYSSDLDEVLALADRLLVLYQGRVREIPPDREAAGRAMLGVA